MDDVMLVSNATVFGPGPGQVLWFFIVWSLINFWFVTVYLPNRKRD